MSDRDDIVREAIKHPRANASGWVRVDCPFCDDSRGSFAFNTRTGGYVCNRTAACGVKGYVKGYEVSTAAREAPRPPPGGFKSRDFVPLWQASAMGSITLLDAVEYVRRRGLSGDDVYFAKIHAAVGGKYHGRIVIPHADEKGEWWGFTARKWTDAGESPKVLYPPGMPRKLYNGQALRVQTKTPCLVVEGCLDAVRYLPDVVACLGKPTEDHLDEFAKSARPIVFALDGDASSEARSWSERVWMRGVDSTYVVLKPGEDPATVDPDELREVALMTSRSHKRFAPARW